MAILLFFACMPAAGFEAKGDKRSDTVFVASANARKAAKEAADFVCDGMADQQEINAAIRSLGDAGGTVSLSEGVFHIARVDGALGGVLIDRSNVTLIGQGASTKLRLGSDQNTNVIRVIGKGVRRVTIRDLWVDANRNQNHAGMGDPNISHDRFEFCGIKALSRAPRGETVDDVRDITVRNCVVENAHRLGIMLEGVNMRVLDNELRNCSSDVVEILTGPGIIRGNYVEITETSHVAIGSDRGNSIIMQGNVVHVRKGGKLDIGFRSWADSERHVISGNIVTVDAGGICALAMDIRGRGAAITGNNVHATDPSQPTRIKISSGGVTFTGNVLQNAILDVDDETGKNFPILLGHNILENSKIEHKRGNVAGKDQP